MPKSAFAANMQAKICALAVVKLLRGEAPVSPKLINTCYSLVAPDYGSPLPAFITSVTASWQRCQDRAASAPPMHHARPVRPKQSSRMIGSVLLRQKFLVDAAKLAGFLLMGIWTNPEAVWAQEQPHLRHYEIVGDAISDPLTGSKGNPTAGRAIVISHEPRHLRKQLLLFGFGGSPTPGNRQMSF